MMLAAGTSANVDLAEAVANVLMEAKKRRTQLNEIADQITDYLDWLVESPDTEDDHQLELPIPLPGVP